MAKGLHSTTQAKCSIKFERIKRIEAALLAGLRFQPDMGRELIQHFHDLIETIQALLVRQRGAG